MHRGFLSFFALLALSATAHADLKLVQQTTMEGELGKRLQKTENVPQVRTVTTYYKAGRMRTEVGEQVTIFDGERTLLLNPKKKTYQAIPKNAGAELANPMLAMMDIKADVSVRTTGKSQAIQGKVAQQYVLTMTMKLGMKSAAEGAPKADMPQIPPITSKTELWTVEFPGITLGAGAARQAMPGGMGNVPFVKDLSEKLKSIKGIPLQTTMTQEVMGKKISVTVKAVSLSESPLPDSLFAPPVGYKQIPYEAPAMPMMPPGG